MKKVFVVTADFELQEKSEWLDEFRWKYDDSFPYHVTLKTPTYVSEDMIDGLEASIRAIVKKYRVFRLNFIRYFFGKTDSGATIMVRADANGELDRLQKEIWEQLGRFGDHVKPYFKDFENNFQPHITIGRHLNEVALEKAKRELPETVFCSATIREIVLTVADSSEFRDISKPVRQVNFKLQ